MRLVVYTAHKEEVYQPIVEEFERRTGVWVPGGFRRNDRAAERIAAEAEAPRGGCDVRRRCGIPAGV